MRGEVTITRGLPKGKTGLDISIVGQNGKTVIIDEASSNITYIGEAAPGTATNEMGWRIMKITVNGNETLIQWAEGDDKFDKVWDNRTSYSYS